MKRFSLAAWLKKPSSVEPDNGRIGRHDQECTPRNSLEFATEAENEARDEIDHARGIRVVHFLQVEEYRNFPAIVLANGGGIPEVSQTYYCDLGTVTHGKLATRSSIVVLDLTSVLGGIPVLVDQDAIIMLGETKPSAGVALHYAGLRRYEPVRGRPSVETMVGG